MPDYDPYGDSDGKDDDGSFFDIKKLQVMLEQQAVKHVHRLCSGILGLLAPPPMSSACTPMLSWVHLARAARVRRRTGSFVRFAAGGIRSAC